MGQFVGCVEGMAEACRALDFPVVSGNVSLYNETKNEDGSSLSILPTPAIGGVGLLEDWENSATIAFKAEGEEVYLVGKDPAGWLSQSLWLKEIHGRNDGPPPPVDLIDHREMGAMLREMIATGAISAVHDVSDGGILVAVTEMALAGGIGARVGNYNDNLADVAWAFGEDQGLYIVTLKADRPDASVILPSELSWFLGFTGGDAVEVSDVCSVSLADLRAAHESFFPKLMGSELTPEF
jgi:phosphoribosylformylglycinamidine synthase